MHRGSLMLDDAKILARLDSDLLASLTHAAEQVAQATRADVAACRVVNGPAAPAGRYLQASRLRLPPRDEESLLGWLDDEDSVFAYVQARGMRAAVFRPRDLMDELTYARHRLFRRLDAVATVHDCVCATFEVGPQAWCVLALVRTAESGAFGDDVVAFLDRMRPALGRVVGRGFEREMKPRGHEMRVAGDQVVRHPVSTSELLAKLSRTELQVLNYLRGDSTEREIASNLGRSPHTVHVHVKNIYRKLGVTSRKHLTTMFRD